MRVRVLCRCVAWACFLLLLTTAFAQAQDIQPQDQEGQPGDVQPQQGTQEAEAPAMGGGGVLGADYVIGPEDMLTLEVMNVPELKETVRVENDGTIPVRLLGHVKAAGLTTSQLRTDLEKQWGESYLEDPKVSVFIREFHAQPISVIGAVAKPGLYQLTGPRSLIEVISMAGGLATKPSPAGRFLYVTRKEGFDNLQLAEGMEQTAPDQIEIDLKQLVQSRDPALNIKMKPFDIVSVTKAGVIYVVGAVKKPGGFVMEDRERVTVLQALSLAEGTGPYAKKSAARIVRQGENGSRQEIPVDLGKVIKGTGEDVEMAANDVLIVPDSSGKYWGQRGVDLAISTLSAALIYGAIF